MTMGGFPWTLFSQASIVRAGMVCVTSGPAVSLLAGLAFAFLARKRHLLLSGVNFPWAFQFDCSGLTAAAFSLCERLPDHNSRAVYLARICCGVFSIFGVCCFPVGTELRLLLLWPGGAGSSKLKIALHRHNFTTIVDKGRQRIL